MRFWSVLLIVLMASAGALAQTPTSAKATAGQGRTAPVTLPTAVQMADVTAFERDMEAAVVRGDVAYLDRVCAPDFTFTHGDGWTQGNPPLRVENREQWLASIAAVPYLSRDLSDVKVELHGDIAITYGRYHARMKTGAEGRREFTVWFERVYARRNGAWQYVSHRTVRGPLYGAVSNDTTNTTR